MEKGVLIEVFGHQAKIDRLLPRFSINGEEEFIAVVEFGEEHPWGFIEIGVAIPAKRYSKEELIELVIKATEKAVNRDLEEKQRRKEEEAEFQKLQDLSQEVAQELGL